jgi:predicted transposase YbfD/YdcC
VVSARAGEEELIMGQLAVDENSNEIRAIPKLSDLLDVKGAMAVKDKQSVLRQDVREYFEGLESGEIRELPEDVWISEDETGHGRTEKREARTAAGVDWMAGKKDRPDLATIIQYRCRRTVNGKQTVSGRYYISNTNRDAG